MDFCAERETSETIQTVLGWISWGTFLLQDLLLIYMSRFYLLRLTAPFMFSVVNTYLTVSHNRTSKLTLDLVKPYGVDRAKIRYMRMRFRIIFKTTLNSVLMAIHISSSFAHILIPLLGSHQAA